MMLSKEIFKQKVKDLPERVMGTKIGEEELRDMVIAANGYYFSNEDIYIKYRLKDIYLVVDRYSSAFYIDAIVDEEKFDELNNTKGLYCCNLSDLIKTYIH